MKKKYNERNVDISMTGDVLKIYIPKKPNSDIGDVVYITLNEMKANYVAHISKLKR